MITKKYYKVIRVSHQDSGVFHITNTSLETGYFTCTPDAGFGQTELLYSLDGVNFQTYDLTEHPQITVMPKSNIYLKGTHNGGYNRGAKMNMNFTQSHTAAGNIFSLSHKNDYTSITSINGASLFNGLFYGDTHLTSIKDISLGNVVGFTSGKSNVFANAFNGCTSLVDVFDFSQLTGSLPDTTLEGTFSNCTSLKEGLDVTNITQVVGGAGWGMNSTYAGCTSLEFVYAPTVSTWENMNSWLSNVSASGIIYCKTQAVADLIPSGASGCPSGWTKTVL